jgi:hypothetical protein
MLKETTAFIGLYRNCHPYRVDNMSHKLIIADHNIEMSEIAHYSLKTGETRCNNRNSRYQNRQPYQD